MNSRWQAEKSAVASVARQLLELGLVTGSSGNVSWRLGSSGGAELMAITPTGRPHADLKDEDIALVDFDIEPVEGDLAPSSESLMHVAIYRARPDVRAVIHTHAVYSSVAAVAGLAIPPIVDEMAVALGGAIEVSDYAFPGTMELADSVRDALGEKNAALIRNHGAVGVGSDLKEAMEVCKLTERVAQVYVMASILGKVSPLPEDIVEAETAIFRMRRQSAVG